MGLVSLTPFPFPLLFIPFDKFTGPPIPNSTIGDTEGESVAWCTKPGRGTRLIPAGALTGVQFMRTSAYVQVTGHILQQFIDIAPDDGGGEVGFLLVCCPPGRLTAIRHRWTPTALIIAETVSPPDNIEPRG